MIHLFTMANSYRELADQIIEQVQLQLIPGVDVYKFAMAIADPNGNLLATNIRFNETNVLPATGMEPFNILDNNLAYLTPLKSGAKKALKGESALVPEISIIPPHANGADSYWYEVWCLPIFSPDNTKSVLGILLILENVTHKRLALAEVESLRKLVIETRVRQSDILKKISALEERNGVAPPKRPIHMPPISTIRTKYSSAPRREKEIFEKLAAGHSVKEVASMLGIGPKSVYTYRTRLLTRLRLKSDVELAIAWRELHES